MKKIYFYPLALVLLALVFFTFFGGQLYELGKPTVRTQNVATIAGYEGLKVPVAALTPDGGHVFVLTSSEGYSRTVYTVARVKVEIIEEAELWESVFVSAEGGVRHGDRVVTETDGELTDGGRVLVG